jgi:hypothetical protein
MPTETRASLRGTAANEDAPTAIAIKRNFFQLMMIPPLKLPPII